MGLDEASGADFGATDAGAAYLYNGQTGALISALYGSQAYDYVGRSFATALQGNDNFYVRSDLCMRYLAIQLCN